MLEFIMPNTFDFYSKVNELTKGQKYSAKRIGDIFVITWSLNGKDTLSYEEKITKVYYYLKRGDWIIIA